MKRGRHTLSQNRVACPHKQCSAPVTTHHSRGTEKDKDSQQKEKVDEEKAEEEKGFEWRRWKEEKKRK